MLTAGAQSQLDTATAQLRETTSLMRQALATADASEQRSIAMERSMAELNQLLREKTVRPQRAASWIVCGLTFGPRKWKSGPG